MHPFAGQARSGNKAKFKAITGKAGGGQVHGDEAQDRKLFRKMMASEDRGEARVSGAKGKGRADKYARGGRAGKVNINIVVPQGDKSAVPPPMPPLPLGLPPGAGPLPSPGVGGPPMPPPGMKTGGRIKKAEGGSATQRLFGPRPLPGPTAAEQAIKEAVEALTRGTKKARGGRFTGGAESGVGRLEKKAHAKGRR